MSTTEQHDQQHEEHADGIVENRENKPPVYFNVLFYGLIIWGVIFMAYFLFSGWSSSGEFQEKMAAHKEQTGQASAAAPPPAPAAPAAAEQAAPDAAGIYNAKCAVCHGADAKGGVGPDLTGDYKSGKSADAIRESVAKGRTGGMPAFGTQLDDAETDALVELLQSY